MPSRTERQSRSFRRSLALYRALGRPVPADTENKLSLELANGSRIVALPGNEASIRGFSGVTLLLIDEGARVPDDLYFRSQTHAGGCWRPSDRLVDTVWSTWLVERCLAESGLVGAHQDHG